MAEGEADAHAGERERLGGGARRPAPRHILSDYDRDPEPLPGVVISGREFTWEEFGRIILACEGWQFKLEILEPSAEA